MSFSEAVRLSKLSDNPLIQGFEKLWTERRYSLSAVRTIAGKAFIAYQRKEFSGVTYTKIYYLFVLPKYQRQGLGKRLISNLKGDVLYVAETSNKPSINFIKNSSLGFKLAATLPNEFGGTDAYYVRDSSANNGGPTAYYDFDPSWKGAGDIIEGRGMNFNQGSMLKSVFCFNVGRHEATNYERELNKIIYFANRELQRCKKKI